MYKKIIKTMIILNVVFLAFLYILKIFIPEKFIIVIENDNLISIGNYIDNNLWLHILLGIITSFVTYWLYLGAVTRKWCLNWKEIVAVIIVCISTQIFYYFVDANLGSTISLLAMICLPLISNAKLKDVAIVFSLHYISQFLSICIRQQNFLLVDTNYIIILLMGIECYFWLLLFYLYFNLKGE